MAKKPSYQDYDLSKCAIVVSCPSDHEIIELVRGVMKGEFGSNASISPLGANALRVECEPTDEQWLSMGPDA